MVMVLVLVLVFARGDGESLNWGHCGVRVD